METSVTVTAAQAIRRIRQLIGSGDDQGALDFWQMVERDLRGCMSAAEMSVVGDWLSSAERALGIPVPLGEGGYRVVASVPGAKPRARVAVDDAAPAAGDQQPADR